MVHDTHPPRNQWSHWWWAMVPTHPNIDANPLIYRPVYLSRSISMVNSITLIQEYSRWYWRSIRFHLRRITVDRWSSINNWKNLWSISSTTPGQLWSLDAIASSIQTACLADSCMSTTECLGEEFCWLISRSSSDDHCTAGRRMLHHVRWNTPSFFVVWGIFHEPTS